MGSSQTRARTRVPCIGRWILNHCATMEVQVFLFLQSILTWGLDSSLSFLCPFQILQDGIWGLSQCSPKLYFKLHLLIDTETIYFHAAHNLLYINRILLYNFCINLTLLFQETLAQEYEVENNYCFISEPLEFTDLNNRFIFIRYIASSQNNRLLSWAHQIFVYSSKTVFKVSPLLYPLILHYYIVSLVQYQTPLLKDMPYTTPQNLTNVIV